MNDLCADIGTKSINHYGEIICGDHVDIVDDNMDSIVVVLADGLGSGVKASILSTLTSKIISTMMADGIDLEECVSTIAMTLPVSSIRGVAYSTFTIINLINNETAEIIQYDNPKAILIRNGKNLEYESTESEIQNKKIRRSTIKLQDGDIIAIMSDGVTHSGIGTKFAFGWERSKIIAFMEGLAPFGLTAKTMATMIVDKGNEYYGEKPGDDTTACVVRMRRRVFLNMLFGPPYNPEDCGKMMAAFFKEKGLHVVCGGTTSSIAAKWLHKPIEASLDYEDADIPPIAKIEGVDLVTEGVITVSRVVENARDYVNDNETYEQWSVKQDAASKLSHLLFEEATDINFYIGRAMNPAHQNPDLPINFNIKMNLVQKLTHYLKKMGKRVIANYY